MLTYWRSSIDPLTQTLQKESKKKLGPKIQHKNLISDSLIKKKKKQQDDWKQLIPWIYITHFFPKVLNFWYRFQMFLYKLKVRLINKICICPALIFSRGLHNWLVTNLWGSYFLYRYEIDNRIYKWFLLRDSANLQVKYRFHTSYLSDSFDLTVLLSLTF